MTVSLLAVLLGGCGGTSQPSDESIFSGYPAITVPAGGESMQCRSQKVEGMGTVPQFRSTYFTVTADGTETVQSEAIGPTPCP